MLLVYKFVFGIVAFVAVVAVGSISTALLAAPLVYDEPTGAVAGAGTAGQYRIGSWTVGSLPEALAVAAGGIAVLLVGLHLLNALARIHARSTAAILRVRPGI